MHGWVKHILKKRPMFIGIQCKSFKSEMTLPYHAFMERSSSLSIIRPANDNG